MPIPTTAAPLREEELRALTTCACCQKKLAQTGCPFFWKVTIERHLLDIKAVQRQDGLAAMIGNSAIASALNPVDAFTIPAFGPLTVMICDECSCSTEVPIAFIAERAES